MLPGRICMLTCGNRYIVARTTRAVRVCGATLGGGAGPKVGDRQLGVNS